MILKWISSLSFCLFRSFWLHFGLLIIKLNATRTLDETKNGEIIYAMHIWKWIGQHIIKTVRMVHSTLCSVDCDAGHPNWFRDMANKFIANETWYKYIFGLLYIYRSERERRRSTNVRFGLEALKMLRMFLMNEKRTGEKKIYINEMVDIKHRNDQIFLHFSRSIAAKTCFICENDQNWCKRCDETGFVGVFRCFFSLRVLLCHFGKKKNAKRKKINH